MEVGALTSALRRHWLAAAVTFAVVATVTQLAAFLPQTRYEATAVVSVQPARSGINTDLLDFLIPELEARLTGSSFANDVAAALPADLRSSDWAVTTSVEPGSGVLEITVNSADRRVPAVAANAYAVALGDANLGTQALAIQVIDAAATTVETSPRTAILVLGLALAVILAFLVAVARLVWDDTLNAAGSTRGLSVPRRPATETRTGTRLPVREEIGVHD